MMIDPHEVKMHATANCLTKVVSTCLLSIYIYTTKILEN